MPGLEIAIDGGIAGRAPADVGRFEYFALTSATQGQDTAQASRNLPGVSVTVGAAGTIV